MSNAETIERLRKDKAIRDEARKVKKQELQIARLKDRDEGIRAGRDWAKAEATLDDFEAIASAAKSNSPERNRLLNRFGPPGSSDFRGGFIEGALAVWDEVKDQL